MGKFNKKNDKITITVKEAKHQILLLLIKFTSLPKIVQVNLIQKLFKDGWF